MSILTSKEYFNQVRLIGHKPHLALVGGKWIYYYDGQTPDAQCYRARMHTKRLNRARGLKDE